MTGEHDNGAATMWRGQPVTRVEISLDQLRGKALRFERRILWRNIREYAAGAVVLGIFGCYVVAIPVPLVRLGSVLIAAGALFALWALHARGASGAAPASAAFTPCLEFHRTQLERQRDLLRGVWTWYLLPFVPGLAVFLFGLLGWTLAQPNAAAHRPLVIGAFVATGAACALAFAAVGRLNRAVARRLQREIDALSALAQES